jgi:hypothetical protein
MTLWYLASPYSKYKDGIEAAFNLVLDLAYCAHAPHRDPLPHRPV